jgi:hypothetical protein
MISSLEKYNPILWLETLAVLAFGISWLTKNRAILRVDILPFFLFQGKELWRRLVEKCFEKKVILFLGKI